MKSAKPLAALTVVVLGVAGVSALLSDAPAPSVKVEAAPSPVATVDRSTWRQAVADWPCLQAEGVTVDKLREVCLWGKLKAGHIICLTDRVAVHKCEVDPPAELLKRYGVCRYQQDGQWQTWAGWADIGAPVPPGWTCQVILPSGFWHQSMGGVEDALVLALRDKCGWGEAITGDRWYCCPHCKMWPSDCPPTPDLCKYGPDWPNAPVEIDASFSGP